MPQSHGEPAPGIEDVLTAEAPRHRHARRIHRNEVALVALALLELCALPWAYGGVDAWSQLACACASICALAVALVPRVSRELDAEGRRRALLMWPRLRRFPVFWAGLALLGYIAVQGLNPSYAYRLEGTSWWLDPLPHCAWLPSGMTVPFGDMNGWRVIALWGSVWALVCALWTGITRRSSVQAIFVGLVANAFAFAVFGIVERAAGAHSIYGIRPVVHPDFFAAFIYRNHAAAYFSLLASLGLGMTVKAFWRARTRMDSSGLAIIHLLLVLTMAVALVITGSFAAIGLFCAMLAVLVPFIVWRYHTEFRGPSADSAMLGTAAGLIALAVGLAAFVGYEGIRDRVESVSDGGGHSATRVRLLADQRGAEMLEDRWLFGWGAGSFRYGFTKYQRMEAELARISGVPVHWQHVHDDWLEFLIELGMVGVIPIALVAAIWLRHVVKLRLWLKLPAMPMLGGLLLLALHGFADFPLQNLAILATAASLAALLLRWGEIDGELA